MDQWGRRKISFVASSISFLGWLLICVSYSASALMVAKTIEGFARSMAATTLTVSSTHVHAQQDIHLL
jgi:hypothetical protein